jgi:hypothetical protein
VTYSAFAFLAIAAIASGAPGAFAQQTPESPPASTPPPAAAVTTGSTSEADETAALIAKANATAAANANVRAASTAADRSLTKIEASPEARKKAKEFGFQAEVYNGSTLFCKEDAALGTRIKSKRCMSAYEFEDYSVQLKIARDLMKSKGQCWGGDLCGGIQ